VAVAVELITAAAAISVNRRRFFRVALSGGSTPKPVYAALAEDRDIDWQPWQILWSDERCVPPTSPDSNYHLVKEALLDKLARPPRMVVHMSGDSEPNAAAADYERAVRELVPANPNSGAGDIPRFDLILLGMGGDGHTASLFPGSPALVEQERLVVANPGPPPHTTRLTFTYPIINAARRVLVLVSGEDKAETLRDVLNGPPDPSRLPAQAIHPVDGVVTWLVDEAAFAAVAATL
jgi:6-phosphogluconolactonase